MFFKIFISNSKSYLCFYLNNISKFYFRLPNNALQTVCYILGLRPGSNTEMVHRIISFLLCPSQKQIESYISGT